MQFGTRRRRGCVAKGEEAGVGGGTLTWFRWRGNLWQEVLKVIYINWYISRIWIINVSHGVATDAGAAAVRRRRAHTPRRTETQLRNGWKQPLHKKLFSFLQMKNGGQAAANWKHNTKQVLDPPHLQIGRLLPPPPHTAAAPPTSAAASFTANDEDRWGDRVCVCCWLLR